MTWWDWSDPAFTLAFATGVVTLLIPVVLAIWAASGARRAESLHALQAESLVRQEALLSRQRRDHLLEICPTLASPDHIALVWTEVQEFAGRDGALLRRAFRSNPHIRLPGSPTGIEVDDVLDRDAIDDYVGSLARRYQHSPGYPGLAPFLSVVAVVHGLPTGKQVTAVATLVTTAGEASAAAGHTFYREICTIVPGLVPVLLFRLENVSPNAPGGLRLNVLTGVLVACVDFELGRTSPRARRSGRAVPDTRLDRRDAAGALAHLLHRNALRSFDRWNLDGSTEPVSATVAWLVRVVGRVCDTDDHLAMRMVENLADSIRSTPQRDRGWGVDARHVRAGFQMIAANQPALWDLHGTDLEAAADEIGPWRRADGSSA